VRAYGKVETGFWQNPKIKALGERPRLLLLYLFSCPHGNSIGCFVLPDGYMQADLGWASETVSEHVSELVSKGFIERDLASSLVRLTGWWGHNTIENANVAKAAVKTLKSLPRCAVLRNAINDLNEIGNKFVNALRNEFDNLFANEFRNPEPNLTEPEPEPEPEPKGAPARPTAVKSYAFEGKIIKLSEKDFSGWKSSYHAIPDLRAELQAIDDKFSAEPPGKSWFSTASAWLRSKHERLLSAGSARGSAPLLDFDREESQWNARLVSHLDQKQAWHPDMWGPLWPDPGHHIPARVLEAWKPKLMARQPALEAS
jgi:hypothetical protein